VGTYLVVANPNYTIYSTNFHKYPEDTPTKHEETPKTYKIVLDTENAPIV